MKTPVSMPSCLAPIVRRIAGNSAGKTWFLTLLSALTFHVLTVRKVSNLFVYGGS